MDRVHPNHQDRRTLEGGQEQQQPFDPQASSAPRSHLSRSMSFSATTQNTYTTQIHDNMSSTSLPASHHKDNSNTSYAGLDLSIQVNDNAQSHLLPSPDSPFGAQAVSRYGAGQQPPTPSFPTLRSSSPTSSNWSTSDHGNSSSNLSGFIPRLHKYF